MLNRELAAQVNERLPDLKTVLRFYGVKFNNKGFALCPFHHEKTASMYCKNDYYYCFGCHASGDAIGFVMQSNGIQFADAVKLLDSDFHLGVVKDATKPVKRKLTAVVGRDLAEKDERNRRESHEREYTRMCAEHRKLVASAVHDAPSSPNEEIKESYADACKKLPYYEWWFANHRWKEESEVIHN